MAALDPEHPPEPKPFTGTGGDRAFTALGLAVGDVLRAAPGATGREQDVASRLSDALWESTLGLFLADFLMPNVTDAAAALLREHVRRHVLPGGPFPALRIGRQPYGLLPVVAPSRYAPEPGLETELARVLGRLRPHWAAATSRAARLGRTTDLDADLTAVLQMTPSAATLRYRPVVGPLTLDATQGYEHAFGVQGRVAEILGLQLGWAQRPFLAACTAQPGDQPLRVPFVDTVAIEPGAPLSRNYLAEIAALARTAGTYEAVQEREDADTLLEALVAHAVARELHRADLRVIDDHLGTAPPIAVSQTTEFVGIETVAQPAAGAMLTTPFEAARLVLGQRSVRETVTLAIRPGATVPSRFGELGRAVAALEYLAERPAEQLDRALRGWLDSCSHRLDAWVTSLATRRLAQVRQSSPSGVHLGGYGWLDDLRPDLGTPDSEGYVHTPSLQQAATAAVLRSGRQAHTGVDHEALDLDLRSGRVRLALGLLDGVANGQPLAALLGYRFERALRERSLELARYILPLRRLVPLRGDDTTASTQPAEAIAARDVVDGVALLERFRTARRDLLGMLDPDIDDRPAIEEELQRLADLYDAVSDVMVAESVHQNVLGNHERAGAVLAALDRQGVPPRMQFVRTPRTGKTFANRVLVLAGDDLVPDGWAHDVRGAAEPRLNAWVARVLGDPTRVRITATATGVADPLVVRLPDLGLSPLSVVLAAHTAGANEPSELEERLIAHVAATLTSPSADTELRLLDTAPDGSGPEVVGLGALRALLRRVYDLVTEARPATAADLATPQDSAPGQPDDAELGRRADALLAAHAAALTALENSSTSNELRACVDGCGRVRRRRRDPAPAAARRQRREAGAERAGSRSPHRDAAGAGSRGSRRTRRLARASRRRADSADPRCARRAIPRASAVHRRRSRRAASRARCPRGPAGRRPGRPERLADSDRSRAPRRRAARGRDQRERPAVR